MTDSLERQLAQMRAYKESAKRRAGLYSEIAGISSKGASKSLGALRKAPAPGKKIQKIGFLMLWVPEPTGLTCAIGGPMILAGRYLDKKYNGATISDVGKSAGQAVRDIGDFRRAIT